MLAEQKLGGYSSRYRFTGKELDPLSGLYDFGARHYDPRLSVWFGVDPLADETPEWSPYTYGLNNPIRMIDPDGRSADDIIIKGQNNSSLTIVTDLVDISVDASSLGVDFGGNISLGGSDVTHAALDIAGVVDPSGVADAANLSLYASEGKTGDAVISGLGIIPYLGDLAKVKWIGNAIETIDKAVDAAKSKNLMEAAEKGIPKSQLGPSGKPKIHTVSKSNLKEAKDAARNNPKSNSSPVKHSSEKGQKTHFYSTKNNKKMEGKDNVHYENRSSKRNPKQ